jgi:phage-related protein
MEGLKQLVLDDIPDRYFLARLNTEIDCERILSSAGAFELTFICPDPNGYALTDERFTLSQVGTQSITRAIGNIESYPIYQLKGIIDNSSSSFIKITTNSNELKLTGRLSAGETLIIDSSLLTAKVVDTNGSILRNGLPILDELNFPVLNKGTNLVKIETNSATFSELKIYSKSCWR